MFPIPRVGWGAGFGKDAGLGQGGCTFRFEEGNSHKDHLLPVPGLCLDM